MRRIELVGLAALLAGCKPAAVPANNAVETAGAEPPLDLSWERANCREHIGEVSEHPEADARADFAAGKRGGVGFSSQGSDMRPAMPADFETPACPAGRTGPMRYLKALEGDVATCLDVAGMAYVERYNRELTRLCGPAPASKH